MNAGFTPFHGEGSDRDRTDDIQQAYRTLYRLTPAMMHSIDAEGRMVAVSDEWLRVLGYDRDEVLGRPSSDFLTPESRAYLEAVGDREFTEEGGVRNVPYSFRAKDGSTVHVLLSAVGEVDADGNPVRTITVLQDVTEQRKAEEVRDRFAAIMEATPDLVGIADRDQRIVYVNPAGARLMGRDPHDLVGTSIQELHPPGEADRILRECLPAALGRGYWVGETTVVSAKEDGEIPVHMVALVHTDADGEPEFFSTIMRDLRGRKKLEAQLRRSRKMEALGRLAGGIVHDFSNVLNVTSGAAHILAEELDGDHELTEEVEEIVTATERATTLTSQLLALGKGQLMRPEVVDTASAIEEVTDFLQRLVGEAHPVELEIEDGVWPLRVDPAQLEQVIMNLGVNARDAMPEGGAIRIRVRNVPAEEVDDELPSRDADARDWVEVSVRDRGHGMDETVQEQIFEPFFTTKDAEEGTGLGLSTVYGIVRQSGGHIDVWSAPGEGTEFTILLPRGREEPAARTRSGEVNGEAGAASGRRPPGGAPVSRRAARILLVDDDDSVRRVFARFLDRGGHTVLESSDAQGALEILESEPVDILVTDAEMPEMRGPELIRAARERDPALGVVLVSGSLGPRAVGDLSDAVEFLQKPVDLDDLLSCIAGLLAAGREDLGRGA